MIDKTSKKRASPFSIRLTESERSAMQRRANDAGLSIGGYWKSVVFNTTPPRRSNRPSIDQQALAKLLPQLGWLGSNVNQIAKRINTSGEYSPVDINNAVSDIAEIRSAIMKALGYHDDEALLQTLSRQFNSHSP